MRVLSEMRDGRVEFFGSTMWDCEPMPGVGMNLWFDYNRMGNAVSKALSYFRTLIRIYRRARRERPGVVHIQWTRIPALDLRFVKHFRSLGIKVIYTAHNLLPHDSGDKYLKVFQRIYREVDNVIVHSTRTREELMKMFGVPAEKISVIPHGILDMDSDVDGVAERADDLRCLTGTSGKLVFASMGLQSQYKGVDNIVRVWTENDRFRNNPACHLLLVGRNKNLDYTPLDGVTNVTVVDEKVDNLDFMAYMQLADVVLLPYRKISQSGVLFTALTHNIPVLVSNVGGLPDPLSVADVGWNIGQPSKENLESVMLGLLEDPDAVLMKKQNIREFEKVRAHYDWSEISRLTSRLYCEILR